MVVTLEVTAEGRFVVFANEDGVRTCIGEDLGKYQFDDSPDVVGNIPADIRKEINQLVKQEIYLKQRAANAP